MFKILLQSTLNIANFSLKELVMMNIDGEPLNFAVVCSSNMNRSMEAHLFMKKKRYKVQSFGTGSQVKLPGTSQNKPNVYSFDWKYSDILQELKEKDKAFYTRNGILGMLERNTRVKERPEKFQLSKEIFDIIISLDERVYDQILEYFHNKRPVLLRQVHVINLDIRDNHEEATVGAFAVCDIAKKLAAASDLDDEIEELLLKHEEESRQRILHSVHFY